MTAFDGWTEMQLLLEMRKRGYLVRHESEVRQSLSWHHLEPAPDDFEDEALQKIKMQITKDHLQFSERKIADGKTVKSAHLQIV